MTLFVFKDKYTGKPVYDKKDFYISLNWVHHTRNVFLMKHYSGIPGSCLSKIYLEESV